MSYTNQTPNYGLPQYVGTDKPTFLGDFNNAMEKIDTALHNNAENAGEGLAQLQQAQNQLTETQNAQSELNEEVSNIGGIASTVNQNVQQALTAANDATEAANSAKDQIEPAVTAANNASAAAAEAKTVADQNTTSVNNLSERVTALEESAALPLTFEAGYQPSTGSTTYTHAFTGLDANADYYIIIIPQTSGSPSEPSYSDTDDQAQVSKVSSTQYPGSHAYKVSNTTKVSFTVKFSQTKLGWSWYKIYKGNGDS